jgi:hypothetical protein
MKLSEYQLSTLPVKHGFRLRGMDMTRLETFCDAAFAFATTLLVISVGTIPESYEELILALKGVPSFAVMAATGFVSALFALTMPTNIAVWAGFVYATLPITMPIKAIYYAKKAKKAES